MKRCSSCGQQNEDTANLCRGCGQPLDRQSPGQDNNLDNPADTPVTVASFQNLEEAELLKSELEAVGIEAYIPEEYATGVFSSITPFQKVTVRVPAESADAARSIVAAFAAASKTESGQSEPTGDDTGDTREPEGSPNLAGSPKDDPPGMTRCGSCEAYIPLDSVLCPKCGWTQPRLA